MMGEFDPQKVSLGEFGVFENSPMFPSFSDQMGRVSTLKKYMVSLMSYIIHNYVRTRARNTYTATGEDSPNSLSLYTRVSFPFSNSPPTNNHQFSHSFIHNFMRYRS